MLLNHRPNKILVTGKSGSGKSTYFSRYVLNSFRTRYRYVFLFDHEGEFAYRNGLEPCLTVDALNTSVERGFIHFDPSDLFPGDLENAFNFFCEWTFEISRMIPTEIKLFGCDELQKLLGTDRVAWELALLLETGRRYGIDLIAVSQQLNLIHNRVRNQLSELVTFQHTDSLVLDTLEEHGFDRESVAALETGEYHLRNFQTGAEETGRLFS